MPIVEHKFPFEFNIQNCNTFTFTTSADSVTEGDAGTKQMIFTLTLDKAPLMPVVVNYAVDGSGTATSGSDFLSAAGSVTFAVGQTTAQVSVTVLADDRAEANETVVLKLTGTNLAAPVFATGTITDDDAAPVFTSPAAVTFAENGTAGIQIDGNDPDNSPGQGTLTLSGADANLFNLNTDTGTLTFKAAPNFEAPSDSGANNVYNVTLRGTDGSGNATEQNLAITVSNVNEAPTAVALSNTTTTIAENTATTTRIKVADLSVSDDALGTNAYSLSGADAASFEVAGGALYLKAGTTLNYEAKATYNVTVNAADASVSGSSAVSANYALAVSNVNETPVVVADGAFSVVTGHSITLNLVANDTDLDGTQPTLASTATVSNGGGSVAVVNGQLVYTAPVGFQGEATISYAITDGSITVPVTQVVTVTEPRVTASASVNEGQDIVLLIQGAPNTTYALEFWNSIDTANNAYGILAPVTDASGNVSITIPTLADRLTEGVQSFRAHIIGTLAAPTVITVNDTSLDNVAPTVTAVQAVSMQEDQTATINVVGADADGDLPLTYTITTAPANGTVTGGANGTFIYTPNANYNGADSFEVEVADALGATATQTVNVTVAAVNDAPEIAVGEDAPSVNENTTLVTSFAITDADAGDTSVVTLSGEDAALFQIVAATGNLEFRTAPDFEAPTDVNRDGIYNVTLTVTDSRGASSSQAVAITVADAAEVGRVYSLTGGGDTGVAFTADSGNDTFNALDTTNGGGNVISTWTVGDAIDGGDGNDTFNIFQTAAIANPLASSVANIETVNAVSDDSITLDASKFSGLTTLNSTTDGAYAQTLTAASTTDVNVYADNVADAEIAVAGGNNVNLNITGFKADAVTPAGGIAVSASGNVTVNVTAATLNTAGTTATATGIAVNGGGETITVNQMAGAIGTLIALSEVAVTGGTSTTSVVVRNAGYVAPNPANASVSVGAAITISDSAVGATDSISSVTLQNFGDTTIKSSALTTLDLTGATVLADAADLTLDVDGQDDATTLDITSMGYVGTISGTQAAKYTTINIKDMSAGPVSHTWDLSAAAVETITISSGENVDQTLTFTDLLVQTVDASGVKGKFEWTSGAGGVNLTVTGAEGDNTIDVSLSTGISTVTTTDGDDTITTGTQGDTIDAGDGDNIIDAGEGDNTITAGDGDNTIDAGDGGNTITAGDGDNTITAGVGANTITTGDGDNTITVGDPNPNNGANTITTGSGDDDIVAGTGDDTIVAGDGANIITGGEGADKMTGGAGIDTYTYAAVSESQGVTVDEITDFDATDVLDFSAITTGTGEYLGEAGSYGAVISALSASATAEAVLDTSNNMLYVDINGDGAINADDMVIELTGVTTLDDAANFIW